MRSYKSVVTLNPNLKIKHFANPIAMLAVGMPIV